MEAVKGGDLEKVRVLMEKGFRFDQADRYGWIPLHYAAFHGRKEAVEFLISRGIDGNRRTLSGKSAYNLCLEMGGKDISQLLSSKGFDSSPPEFPVLEGEYLGQQRPGEKPEVFALGIVSSPETEHGSVTFSPDSRTIYWTAAERTTAGPPGGSFKVYSSHREKDRWTAPQHSFFYRRSIGHG